MSITTAEFLNKLTKARLRITNDDSVVKIASYSALAKQSTRIFTNGLASDGTEIGKYSTEDIWINPSSENFEARSQRGFVPLKGKKGNTEFKSNPSRVRKTSYFEGWKGLREVQGLPVDNVKLDFSGELFSDFCNPQGSIPTTRKVTNTEYVTSLKKDLSSVKLRGNEERFGKTIGNLTEDEKKTYFDAVRFEMRKLIAGDD